jgi:hypothetical protein
MTYQDEVNNLRAHWYFPGLADTGATADPLGPPTPTDPTHPMTPLASLQGALAQGRQNAMYAALGGLIGGFFIGKIL